MSTLRINELPDGSGSLSIDDVFLFMDDPSGSGITKKISLSEINSTITGDIVFNGTVISTIQEYSQGIDLKSNYYSELWFESSASGLPYNYYDNPAYNSASYIWTSYDGAYIENARTDGWDYVWQFNNDGNLVLPGNLILPNNSTLAAGTYDNGLGGNYGISLNCVVGYQLNWQAGHLKNTIIGDNTNTAQIIYVDSPITYSPATLSLSFNTTIAVDCSSGEMFDITLTDNILLDNPTNPVNGKTIRFRISQDGNGNRSVTLGSKFNLPTSASPLSWSTSANATDIFAATYHESRDKWDIVAFVPGY